MHHGEGDQRKRSDTMYNVIKQLGPIEVKYNMEKNQRAVSENILNPPTVEFEERLWEFGGVKKHDDNFLIGDSSIPGQPFYNGGGSFMTKTVIDLRTFFDEGKVLDDIKIDLQRPIEIPRIYSMYNVDPSAEIYETILITTDANPNDNSDLVQAAPPYERFYQPVDWFLAGFSPRRAGPSFGDFEGIAFPKQVVMAQTRIYAHDPSRNYQGTTYLSHSDDETNYPTIYYETLAIQDSVVRGYPDMVYSPQLTIYRIITTGYYLRTPTITDLAITAMESKAELYFPPVQVSISGNMRSGTETERIMEATNILLAQPDRPDTDR